MRRDEKEGERLLRAALGGLQERVQPTTIDELWIFPARRNGEVESLVVVATVFDEESPERRRILTASFSEREERTRRGRAFHRVREEVAEQGTAPADRVGRVVAGVMRRLDEELATLAPHSILIGGSARRWAELLGESASTPDSASIPGTACAEEGV